MTGVAAERALLACRQEAALYADLYRAGADAERLEPLLDHLRSAMITWRERVAENLAEAPALAARLDALAAAEPVPAFAVTLRSLAFATEPEPGRFQALLGAGDDPTGERTLLQVHGARDMATLQQQWERYVMQLRFP